MAAANARDGSYFLSTGAALGAGACVFLTAVILHTFGASLGTTASGKTLLSWANVAVHLLGVVLMGLALGHFLNKQNRNKTWAFLCAVVMIAAGGLTLTNLYGFASGERMSATQAVEDAKARIAKDAADRTEAAKARLAAQERLAKGQMQFMQSEVKDSTGKQKRALTKDFAKNSAALIAEIGKEQPAAPATEVKAELSPDEGAAQLAQAIGMSTRAVQVVLAMWIAGLLVVLEMLLWPMASFTWPRAMAVAAQASPPLAIEASPAVQDLEPVPRPLVRKPLMIDHQAPVVDVRPPMLRRAHLPEATSSLEAINFPLRNLAGEIRSPEHYQKSAERFLVWLQACGLCAEPTPKDEVATLYLEFCAADHREPAAWNVVSGHLRSLRPVYFGKLTQPDGSRAHRYTIKAGKYPKPSPQPSPRGEEKPSPHPKQEGATVHELRPLAVEPGNEPATPRKVLRSFKEQFDHPILNAARAHWMRRDARNMNRKQRGPRRAA